MRAGRNDLSDEKEIELLNLNNTVHQLGISLLRHQIRLKCLSRSPVCSVQCTRNLLAVSARWSKLGIDVHWLSGSHQGALIDDLQHLLACLKRGPLEVFIVVLSWEVRNCPTFARASKLCCFNIIFILTSRSCYIIQLQTGLCILPPSLRFLTRSKGHEPCIWCTYCLIRRGASVYIG